MIHNLASEEAEEALINEVAASMWRAFSRNEREGVRCGIFSSQKMNDAEVALKARGVTQKVVKRLAAALMKCAANMRSGT